MVAALHKVAWPFNRDPSPHLSVDGGGGVTL
jgi:hypothetical protein